MFSPALLAALLQAAQPVPAPSMVVRGVSVINPVTGLVAANRTIVIRGNRIVAVGGKTVAAPRGAVEVDGTGKFAIPGLWDMHTHALFGLQDQNLPLMVANGITGYREMWGTIAQAKQYRTEVASGRLAGPRFVASGNIVDGFPAVRPGEVVVRTPDEGRRAVDSLADAGAGFIKVYSMLDSASFTAVARRARARGIPFGGHVPYSISAVEAARLGQHSMEHLNGVTEACSTDEAAILRDQNAWLAARARDSTSVVSFVVQYERGHARVLQTFDEATCIRALRRMAGYGAWQVPTIGVIRMLSRFGDPALERKERAPYLAGMLRGLWTMMASDTTYARFGRADESKRAFHELERRIVGLIGKYDLPVLAGTDAPNPFTYIGFGLHDELEYLVSAGLTPLQALRAATINPARYFNATDSLGTIAPGKLADLVLLDANPLSEIANTRRIQAVVANGRLFRRGDLDALLDGVARAVAAEPTAKPE